VYVLQPIRADINTALGGESCPELALEAGFNNRQSYYNARKRVREAS